VTRWAWPLLMVLIAGVALAGDDPRGWTAGGVVAKNTARVLGPLPTEMTLDLPDDLTALVTGPTLLVYFAPTCPHCQAVAPELAELATRAQDRLQVIAIATGRSAQEDLDAFALAFGWKFPVLRDHNGKIASAMGVQSTPSAVLVTPGKKHPTVVDVWYPYRRGLDTLVLMRVLERPWDAFAPDEYQGNVACAMCHSDEGDAWALTHHSVAWKTLVTREKAEDPACTKCHVVGQGLPTGFDGPDSILVDVGSEACHGPGGPHDGVRAEPLAQCGQCHDEDHSIGFSVARGVPLLDHYRTVGWDDERWRVAREALVGGKVERQLVGFAEGETAGSEACTGCHAAEHDVWAAGPHAHAFELLDAGQQTDVSCVRCHASARVPGPAASEVAGYRTTEGVGCEACHGPGKAHVDSGGKAPIEGLGEDCPVCVVEALCTTCHTPEQDPAWSLDAKLPLVGHSPR
jgi:thiol-disulfide isomerase/thioredoxin